MPPAQDPTPSEPRAQSVPQDWRTVAAMRGFHRSVGFSIDPARTRAGTAVVQGKIEEMHLNVNMVVHGGVYATLLDTAMGAAVVTTLKDGEITATTSLYVDFLRPARLGQELTCEGKVIRRGRNIAFADGHVRDGGGEIMGTGRGTWYIWRHDGPLPERLQALKDVHR